MKRWGEMTTLEKDALVAEKVMGWNYHPTIYSWDEVLTYGHWRNELGEIAERLPQYCENIADAWVVVDRLKSTSFRVNPYAPEKKYKYVRTTITHTPKKVKVCIQTDGWSHRGEALTLPMAICLAALKAVGVDIDV